MAAGVDSSAYHSEGDVCCLCEGHIGRAIFQPLQWFRGRLDAPQESLQSAEKKMGPRCFWGTRRRLPETSLPLPSSEPPSEDPKSPYQQKLHLESRGFIIGKFL